MNAEIDALKQMISYLNHQKAVLAVHNGAHSRQSLLGDSYLRLATTTKKSEDNLLFARKSYERAKIAARNYGPAVSSHACIRIALCDYLLGAKGAPLHEIFAQVNAVVADLTDTADTVPSFENARLLGEAKLFQFLTEPDTEQTLRNQMVEEFNQIFMSDASPGQRNEIIADLKTVKRLMDEKNPGVAEKVQTITQELERSATTPT